MVDIMVVCCGNHRKPSIQITVQNFSLYKMHILTWAFPFGNTGDISPEILHNPDFGACNHT